MAYLASQDLLDAFRCGLATTATALAANSRRPLPPRCVSIASRVRSDTLVPRRAASWRSRASRSSGSLTVVLFMVCQHTLKHTCD